MAKTTPGKLPSKARSKPRTAGRPAAAEADGRINDLLDIATEVFIENGYENTSVGEIAKRARASKHTLYNRYPTKAELFAAVMIRRSEAGFARVSQIVHSEDPLEVALKSYAFELLLPFIEESLLQLLRTIISAADKFPEVGQSFWNIGPVRAHQFLSEMLKDRMSNGEIRESDPSQAAHLFLAMCSGRYWFRQLVRVTPPVSKSEFAKYADEVVRAFLGIYAPEKPISDD